MVFLFIILLLAPIAVGIHIYHRYFARPKISFSGKTVFITGASSGIGADLAIEASRKGASTIVLLARDRARLDAVKARAEENFTSEKDQQVITLSCDVTSRPAVKEAIQRLKDEHSVKNVDILIVCHGTSIPGYFVEQDESEFEKQISLNYLGVVYITKALLPMMMKHATKDKHKHICFVGSACSSISFIGFSSYSPSKYAVRALAEALDNELQGHNIYIHLAMPADVDTPGFEAENLTKPIENKLISGTVKVTTSKKVASLIVKGIENNRYYITNAFDIDLLARSTMGLGPRFCPIYDAVLQFISLLVGPFYKISYDKISQRHSLERKKRFQHLLDTKE